MSMAPEVVLTTNGLKEDQQCNSCNLSPPPDVIRIRKALGDFRHPSLKNIPRFACRDGNYRLVTGDTFLDLLRDAAQESQFLEEIRLLLRGGI
jgi:hypothetical protein